MKSLMMAGLHHRPVAAAIHWGGQGLRRGCGSDRALMVFTRRVLFWGWHRAQAFLGHYLDGTGELLRFSCGELLAGDPGFAAHAVRAMRASAGRGETAGTLAVAQWRLSNPDWRFALGSFRFAWRKAGDGFVVRAEGRYAWHPEEDRISRPFHLAASRVAGAAPFDFRGEAATIPLSDAARFAAHPWTPRDRLYI